MKKINRIVLASLTTFSLLGMAHVNAKNLDRTSLIPQDLCIEKKENNHIVLSFKMGETTAKKNGFLAKLYNSTSESFNMTASEPTTELNPTVFKKTDKVTCSTENVTGSDITDTTELQKGDFVYIEFSNVDMTKNIYITFNLLREDSTTYDDLFRLAYDADNDEIPYFFDQMHHNRLLTEIEKYAKEKYQGYLALETYCVDCNTNLYLSLTKDSEFGNTVPMGSSINYYEGHNEIGFNYEGDNQYTLEEVKSALDNTIKNWQPNLDWIEQDVENEYTSSLKEALKAIKGLKEIAGVTTVHFYHKDEGNTVYTWIMDLENLGDFAPDSLSVKLDESENKEKIEALVPNKEKALITHFNYHGNLPKNTKIRINVSEKYEEGQKLFFYYYNEKEELEEVARDLEVKNGFVEVALEHCSDYVFTDTEVANAKKSNNAQTGTLNTALYIGIASISLIGMVYILYSKKKRGE